MASDWDQCSVGAHGSCLYHQRPANYCLDAIREAAKRYAEMAVHFERMHKEAVDAWLQDDSGWQKRALAAEAQLKGAFDGIQDADGPRAPDFASGARRKGARK